jgi:hypothetical protein
MANMRPKAFREILVINEISVVLRLAMSRSALGLIESVLPYHG